VSKHTFKIVVCRGPECGDKRGSRSVYDALQDAVSVRCADGRATLDWHSCFGRCTLGPNVLVREILGKPEEQRFLFAPTRGARRSRAALYNGVTPDDALELIDEHVVRGRLVRRLMRRAESPRPAAVSGAKDAESSSRDNQKAADDATGGTDGDS
jgi:NADP-reducing hydrogenase subunit HndC